LNIIAPNFKNLSFNQIKLIQIPILDQILSSFDLQVGNESLFFNTLFQLYQVQPNSISLMKHAFFPAVISNSLSSFFDNVLPEDLPIEVFQSFLSSNSFCFPSYYPNSFSEHQ
jgi:hypothetical protein